MPQFLIGNKFVLYDAISNVNGISELIVLHLKVPQNTIKIFIILNINYLVIYTSKVVKSHLVVVMIIIQLQRIQTKKLKCFSINYNVYDYSSTVL